jgi:hypothetical protein
MTWKPVLSIDIEYQGATLTWRTPDSAMSRYDALMTRHMSVVAAGRNLNPATMTDEERVAFAQETETHLRALMPDDLGEIMCDMFVEGVFAWEGVEGPEGERLACNAGTRRAIPYEDKVAATGLYLQALRAVELGKVPPLAPPITCTADDAATANPSGAGSERVQDSPPPTAPAS